MTVAPVHLHVHSWYSLLEGTAGPELLLRQAALCGYTTLALTDTNNLYGAMAFTEAAHAHGIRPVLGSRLVQKKVRCVALIGELAGYRSLCRILSRLNLTTTPLTDLLLENSEGLQLLVDDAGLAEHLRDAFADRLWIEIVRPAVSLTRERELLECARRLQISPVASCAVHLATPAEYRTFQLASAVRQLTLIDQLPAAHEIQPEHCLVDPATFRRRFHDLPVALGNTHALAEQLPAQVLPREVVLPRPPVPRQHDACSFLRLLCERGLRNRELSESLSARQRLREELAVIEAGNLPGYFLVVRHIARYARRKGYSMALRGSAGNSLVCYLLEITEVNPLRFHLPLERFLHPGRADLPDIDLDFDWKVRDDVIASVFRRYGEAHVAMICTHLFLQPRSAFREAAKIHGLANEQISRMLETLADRVDSLLADSAAPTGTPPARFPLEPERWPRILADARLLLGRPHHLSIHPGGVVITPRPIENYAPLERAAKGVIVTQYEKDAAEYIGLVKIDLLGNRALATVDAAMSSLRAASCAAALKVERAVWNEGGETDPATVNLLKNGDTLGVNQLESPAMRHLLTQMRTARLEDVIQALAMIRPGAASVGMKPCFIRRRRGLEPVRHFHPCLEPLLGETQGLMVYEDDALRVLQAITGLEAPDADRFRKKVAKHRTEAEAAILTEEFLSACARNHIPRPVAAGLWVQLAKFNQYSFCKSHAVSYGLIAWKAAYLKAHHPLHFWTAALNNNQGMYPRRVYIEAIKRAGIPLYLPCINRSAEDFCLETDGIRTGLGAIASLPEEVRKGILADRQQRGPFGDLEDFRRRVHAGPEALGLLIRAGAFDFTRQPRPMLFLEADLQAPASSSTEKLFGDDPCLDWSPTNYSQERRLHDEWNLLGFVVEPKLMAIFRPQLPSDLHTSRELPGQIGRGVRLAGLVATARHTPTNDGRVMQFVTLEDEWGLIEVTLFPGTCPPVAYLALGPYIVTGVVEEQYGVLTVNARRVEKWVGS